MSLIYSKMFRFSFYS